MAELFTNLNQYPRTKHEFKSQNTLTQMKLCASAVKEIQKSLCLHKNSCKEKND